GLLADALGRVPIPGAHAQVHGLELTAEVAGGRRNRIDSVLVRRVPPNETRKTAVEAAEHEDEDAHA
ncbi:MAG TPA: hypothetical protein VGL26_03930, partial [Jatrophihabitans sp.]